MWWTINNGDNWTFGITFTDMTIGNFIDVIVEHSCDIEHRNSKKFAFCDSYFNYLRNCDLICAESFYNKNVDFIHWGAPYGPLHYKFRDGFVIFPKYPTYFFASSIKSGKVNIPREVIPLDVGMSLEETSKFRNKKHLKLMSKLYGVYPVIYTIKVGGFAAIFEKIRLRISSRFH